MSYSQKIGQETESPGIVIPRCYQLTFNKEQMQFNIYMIVLIKQSKNNWTEMRKNINLAPQGYTSLKYQHLG